MDKLVEIHTIDDYKNAIENKSIILFTASWCPDCVFIKPFIGEIGDKYNEFQFYVVDRDEMIDLCKDLDIMGIPSFIGYVNGKETGRFVSKLRKTKDQIEAFIESL